MEQTHAVWRTARIPALFAALVLFCVVGLADMVARPILAPIDAKAEQIIDDIAIRAAATFAISRTINAALSMAEEVSVSAGFVFEGSMKPMSWLEPVNNLIEEFAGIMLAVAVAALILKILLSIGTAWGVSVILALSPAAFCLQTLGKDRPWLWRPRLARLGSSLLLLAFVLRLAFPTAIFATNLLSEEFLQHRYEAAQAELELIKSKAEDASTAASDADETDNAEKSWFSDKATAAGEMVKRAFGAVRDVFGQAFQSVVTLVTVFLFETMLLPVVLVWLLYRAALTLTGPSLRDG